METHRMTLRHWTVFRNIDPAQIAQVWDGMGIPQELPGWQGPIRPVEMTMGKEGLDLTDLPYVEGTPALCITEIDAPAAMRLAVGAGADWWMEWWVNGQMMFATDDGNGTDAFSIENNRFSLELRPGRNVVSVHVRAGSKGWRLVAAPLADLDPVADEGIVYRRIMTTSRMNTKPFSFTHKGQVLRGILDFPDSRGTGYAVLLVHGHGSTRVFTGASYRSIRTRFTQAGLVCCTWDKPGCGNSEGQYDHDQTVMDSADEVVAAMGALSGEGIVERGKIGLWGISRAGWINAVAIEKDPTVAFWISVSPGGECDNYPYLLRENLRLEGRSEEYISLLLDELREGSRCMDVGAPYQRFLQARRHYHQDPLARLLSEQDYLREVSKRKQGLRTPPSKFRMVLARIGCPVLAMFGEKDLNVDWRDSVELYRDAFRNRGDVTVKTYKDMNHCLCRCETGSLRETLDKKLFDMDATCIEDMVSWMTARTYAGR